MGKKARLKPMAMVQKLMRPRRSESMRPVILGSQ